MVDVYQRGDEQGNWEESVLLCQGVVKAVISGAPLAGNFPAFFLGGFFPAGVGVDKAFDYFIIHDLHVVEF